MNFLPRYGNIQIYFGEKECVSLLFLFVVQKFDTVKTYCTERTLTETTKNTCYGGMLQLILMVVMFAGPTK